MTFFYRLCRGIFKLLFSILYRHQIYNTDSIPEGRAIIAPNHISFLDPPLIAISCPENTHFLAKDVLFENFFFRLIISNLNALPVSGRVNDLKTIKTICKTLENDEKVVIFPEGIRSFDGKLREVKPGIALIAMRADAPIVPTFIHGTFEVWPRQNKFPKPWGRTFCSFGTPIFPKDFGHLNKKEAQRAISHKVRDAIEELREKYAPKSN